MTKFFSNLPIGRKLTLITMLISGVALLLACAAFALYEQSVFRRTMADDFAVIANMFDDNVAAGLAFEDKDSIQQTLKTLGANDHIVAAAVYDKSGTIVARYQRPNVSPNFQFPPSQPTGQNFTTDRLDTFHDITLGDEKIGVVLISSDLTELTARAWRYAFTVGLLLLGCSLVTLLLASRLQKVISGPILALARTASLVALDRDYSVRAIKHGDDEVGRLIDGFNGMLTQIQARDADLQLARDQLEKRVEERTGQLRASQERIGLIVDTAFDSIVTTDASDTITGWNSQAEATFGWTRAEAIGKNFAQTVLAPAAREAHIANLRQYLSTGQGAALKKRVELVALHRIGNPFPVELAVSPVRHGDAVLFSVFLRDITERQIAAAEMERINRQLRDTSRQAGMAEVATGVLHNVGNVLNSVNVSATLVADQVRHSKGANLAKISVLFKQHQADIGAFLTTDPKGQIIPAYLGDLAETLAKERAAVIGELENLRKNIEHIKDIVAMQQNYAKNSGFTETVSIPDLVEDALRMNAGSLARHDVDLARDYQARPVVTLDKHKVIQVLINLVRNAKYACDESGRVDKLITVRTTADDLRVRIAVIDNGVGIPPENITRIFGHGFTTRKQGHGFGLHSGALAARELGGSLTVQSEGVGRGATFILELPYKPEDPTHAKSVI